MNRFAITVLALGMAVTGCEEDHGRHSSPAMTSRPATVSTPSPVSPTSSPNSSADDLQLRALRRDDGLARMVVVVLDGIAPAREPGDSPGGEPLRIFSQLYVMEEAVQQGIKYFAVSPDGIVDLGWLPSAACREWPTRLALGPQNEMLVYESASDAKRAALGDSGATAFARSTAGAADQQFPVAETQVIREADHTLHLAKIHFLGQLDANAPLQIETSSLSAAETNSSHHAVAPPVTETSQRLARVDVVVLMDATSSMQPYIEATKTAVAAVARTIASGRADVRFGLVAFRDADAESEWVTRQVVPLVPIERFEQGLAGLNANAGGDEDEDGYAGVAAALSVSWRADNLGQRIVLVVAQTAFHESGSGNPRGFTSQGLGDMAARNGVRIHAMQVEGASPSSGQRLTTQLRDLVIPTGGSVVRVADAQGLAETINRSTIQASSTANVRVAVLEGHASGKSLEEVARIEGVPISEARAAFEFLKASDCIIQPNRPDAAIAAASGWVVAAVDGVPMVRTFVLARRSEITRLTTELFDLTAFADADTPAALRDWALRPRKGSYFEPGGPSTDQSLASFLRGHSVYLSRASLLNLTSQQVRQMPESDRAALRERISKQFLPGLLNVRNSDIWTGPGGTAFVNEILFP